MKNTALPFGNAAFVDGRLPLPLHEELRMHTIAVAHYDDVDPWRYATEGVHAITKWH